jgi:hypothetical protein
MIEYLLMVQVCNNYDGDCVWERRQRFQTEERCVANGLQSLPTQFKCILIGPDQRIPLPRPRPQ